MEVGGEVHCVSYVPGESNTYTFGGNSNWRGPIWLCGKEERQRERGERERERERTITISMKIDIHALPTNPCVYCI